MARQVSVGRLRRELRDGKKSRTMGWVKFKSCMAVIARSYSGCKPIISIVSRESIAVTPHPLKLAVLYVSDCGMIEGI